MRVAILALLILASCTSAAEKQAEQERRAQAIAEEEDSTCRSFGLSFGTDSYADCRVKLATARAERRARVRAAVLGAMIARPQQPIYAPAQVPTNNFQVQPLRTPSNCTVMPMGAVYSVNCW